MQPVIDATTLGLLNFNLNSYSSDMQWLVDFNGTNNSTIQVAVKNAILPSALRYGICFTGNAIVYGKRS